MSKLKLGHLKLDPQPPHTPIAIANTLRTAGYKDLGWMNGWGEKDLCTRPWEEPFSVHDHTRCISLYGDFGRREFYLVDSGD